LGILRGFSYGLLPGKQAADRIHIVMPEDIGHPQFLPPDAVRDSALYDLHESWYARHRVPVFLPRGYRLVPPLDFSSIESLGAILGGVTEGHVFVLRRAPDGGIELGVIPPGGRVPLEAAVEYLNGAVHSGTEALHEVLARSMADEHERAATAIRQDLGRAQREIEEAFRTALMHSEEELNRALQRLRESRNSLGLYRDLLVFLESLEDQAAAFRSGHLSALRDLLVGLEQSLGQVLAKPGGEPSAMADQFHAVLRQWDELRQRQAAEVQAIRGRIDRFLLGHGARREEMARQVDRVLSRWEKEPVAGDVSDMLQVLRDVREKLR
jgi:hypothetical protein